MKQEYHDAIESISKRRRSLRNWLVLFGGMLGLSLGFIINTIRNLITPSENVAVALLIPLSGIFYVISFLIAFEGVKNRLSRWRAAGLAIRYIRYAGECREGMRQQLNIDQANAAIIDMYDEKHCEGLPALKCHKCDSEDVKWSEHHERCFCKACGTQIV